MGSSNRHGGAKVSRRLKVMFNGHPGRHNVFRNYFGVKKSALEVAATGSATPPAAAAPAASTEQK